MAPSLVRVNIILVKAKVRISSVEISVSVVISEVWTRSILKPQLNSELIISCFHFLSVGTIWRNFTDFSQDVAVLTNRSISRLSPKKVCNLFKAKHYGQMKV